MISASEARQAVIVHRNRKALDAVLEDISLDIQKMSQAGREATHYKLTREYEPGTPMGLALLEELKKAGFQVDIQRQTRREYEMIISWKTPP